MATANLNGFLHSLTRGMLAEALREQSDRELVEEFLSRQDEAIFEVLIRRHGPMVYRVCWRVLQQTQEAEDAFQATFLLLAQKLRSVRKLDSLASWLHGVARRVALKAQARLATRRRYEQRAALPQATLSDEITWSELRTVLDTELGRLPEKWRLPLILTYLEGRTQDDAARQLCWSKNTFRRRLDEARAALGRRLSWRGVGLPAAFSATLLSECVASAALPARLVSTTVAAAACGAAAPAVATGIVSADVAALTEAVLRGMLLTRLKIATTVLLALSILGTSAGVLAHHVLAEPAQPRQEQFAEPVDRQEQVAEPVHPVEEVRKPVDAVKAADKVRTKAGVLASVDSEQNTITVSAKDKDNLHKEEWTLRVAAGARITIAQHEKKGEVPVNLADLKSGTSVALQLAEDGATVVAIQAAAPIARGVVKAVDSARSQITVTVGMKDRATDILYEVEEGARISLNDQNGQLSDLQEGTPVLLQLAVKGGGVVGIQVGDKKKDKSK